MASAGGTRRRVGGEHAVSRVEQVTRHEPAATPELDHQPVSFANARQQREDARRTRVCVEAEAAMMNEREIASVIRIHRYLVPAVR
jgi:hypothetical protein